MPQSIQRIDVPNQRSLHKTPIPRIGGLAIWLTVASVWLFFQPFSKLWFALFCGTAALGLVDDFFGLSAALRMFVQLVLAFIFIKFELQLSPSIVMIGGIFGIVWLSNLYNFMDGSDGLASGMAVFGFGAFALMGYIVQDIQLTQICVAIVTASLAFLCFNFHPAKIFMGDGGSIPLGFMAGAIGLYGWQASEWPLWFPIFVFSPFIVDATTTLLKRAIRGERIWEAHKTHYYQRVVQMGWGHKKTALVEYALMLMVCVSAILMLKLPFLWVCGLLLLWAFVYIMLMLKIDKHWKQHQISAQN